MQFSRFLIGHSTPCSTQRWCRFVCHAAPNHSTPTKSPEKADFCGIVSVPHPRQPRQPVHVHACLTPAQRGNLGSMESLKPHAGVIGILKNNRGNEGHLVAAYISPVISNGQAGRPTTLRYSPILSVIGARLLSLDYSAAKQRNVCASG